MMAAGTRHTVSDLRYCLDDGIGKHIFSFWSVDFSIKLDII